MGLNELAKSIHQANVEKGFWPENKEERNKGELLMLVVSEIAEAMEAIRKKDYVANKLTVEYADTKSKTVTDKEYQEWFEFSIKNTFEDELADAIIRLLDMCGAYGINIEKHIELKLKYNKLRPHKHGKNF